MSRFQDAIAFGRIAEQYVQLREIAPTVPASIVHRYILDDGGLRFTEYVCGATTRHDWQINEESDRCYCC